MLLVHLVFLLYSQSPVIKFAGFPRYLSREKCHAVLVNKGK